MTNKVVVQFVITAMCVALAGALIYFFANYPETRRYFYKMEVNVQVGDKLVRASSTREVIFRKNLLKLPDMGTWNASNRGEAVVIPLPDGSTVFTLLPRSPSDVLLAAFGTAGVDSLKSAYQSRSVGYITPRVIATFPDGYPDFVRFRNLLDPSSVETLNPRDLSPGSKRNAHVLSIKIYLTDGPITKSIKRYLPWIGTLQHSFSPPTDPYCPCQFETD
jgi:hypothetical protein